MAQPLRIQTPIHIRLLLGLQAKLILNHIGYFAYYIICIGSCWRYVTIRGLVTDIIIPWRILISLMLSIITTKNRHSMISWWNFITSIWPLIPEVFFTIIFCNLLNWWCYLLIRNTTGWDDGINDGVCIAASCPDTSLGTLGASNILIGLLLVPTADESVLMYTGPVVCSCIKEPLIASHITFRTVFMKSPDWLIVAWCIAWLTASWNICLSLSVS